MSLIKQIKELHIPVKDLDLPPKIFACKPETSLQDAIKIMQKHHIGCLIVSNQERETLGIITERDFVFKISGRGLDWQEEKVGDHMTSHPTTVSEDEQVLNALQFMQLGGFRHVIIADKNDKVRGVISMKNIMEYIYHVIQSKGL